MFGMGMGELVVVFLIILMLFGANKLPEIAQAMGKSVREFKKAANEMKQSVDVDPVVEAKIIEHKPVKNQAG